VVALDDIWWVNPDAWNCSENIATRPFGLTGKFKARRSQGEYVQQFARVLGVRLRNDPTIREVSLVDPSAPKSANL
jgi:hypothetical protein